MARFEFLDGTIIDLNTATNRVQIEQKDDAVSVDCTLDLPVFKNDTGESVVEYSGMATDMNPERSWAMSDYATGGYSAPHYHNDRDEDYYVVQGVAVVELDGERHEVAAGQWLHIPKGAVHKVSNPAQEIMRLVVKCSPSWSPEDSHIVENIQKSSV